MKKHNIDMEEFCKSPFGKYVEETIKFQEKYNRIVTLYLLAHQLLHFMALVFVLVLMYGFMRGGA